MSVNNPMHLPSLFPPSIAPWSPCSFLRWLCFSSTCFCLGLVIRGKVIKHTAGRNQAKIGRRCFGPPEKSFLGPGRQLLAEGKVGPMRIRTAPGPGVDRPCLHSPAPSVALVYCTHVAVDETKPLFLACSCHAQKKGQCCYQSDQAPGK
jgi:hypothetical protein